MNMGLVRTQKYIHINYSIGALWGGGACRRVGESCGAFGESPVGFFASHIGTTAQSAYDARGGSTE